MLKAHCGRSGADTEEKHGRIPKDSCTCGIYATTSLTVVNKYLGTGTIAGTVATQGPVLGLVELGGKVIPATEGFRAEYARIAGILLIDQVYTLPHGRLRDIADLYKCPAIVPHSTIPEDFRDAINPKKQGKTLSDEAEEWLRQITEQ